MQDVTRVLSSLEKVLDAKGCIIDETVRTGRRRFDKNENDNDERRGGSRKKATQEDYLHQLEKGNAIIHSDALSVVGDTGSDNRHNLTLDDQNEDSTIVVGDTSNN